MHSGCPDNSANVPLAQASHTRPSLEKVPGVHSQHEVMPVALAMLPGAHAEQAVRPPCGANVPMEQGTQSVPFENRPGAHSEHAAAATDPRGTTEPRGQPVDATHCERPSAGPKVPAAQVKLALAPS